jgi:hypothetical protein
MVLSASGLIKECDICHKEDVVLFITNYDKVLCPECIRQYDPPLMTLSTYAMCKTIWNFEVGEYEKLTDLYTFEQCGWFVRSRQTKIFQLVPRSVVTIWHLEYYGSARCGRCSDYKYFDKDASYCLPTICEKYVCKQKAEDINYPSERSKYYEYSQVINS